MGASNAGGQALKGMHDLYNQNQNIKLADWMIVAGACNGIFALAIPHLHGLRLWSGIACACTIIFVIIVVGISAWDGKSVMEQPSPVLVVVHAEFCICSNKTFCLHAGRCSVDLQHAQRAD